MRIKAKYIDGAFKPLEEIEGAVEGQLYDVFFEEAETESPRKKRVLIIDDDAGLTRTLKLYLDATGQYEIRTENEGLRGLVSAREFRPDLILLDIIMPDKDGGALAAEIRQDPDLEDTPVVFLTALVSKKDVGDTARDIGGHPFLAKPVEPEQVIECIEKYAK